MSEMNWRHYDPFLGRFNAVDKLAENTFGLSTYVFANNNPVLFSDPSGLAAVYDWKSHDAGIPGIYRDGGRIVSFDEAMASNGVQFSSVDTSTAGFVYNSISNAYGQISSAAGGGGGGGEVGRFFRSLYQRMFGNGQENSIEVGKNMTDQELEIALEQENLVDALINASQNSSTNYTDAAISQLGILIEADMLYLHQETFRIMKGSVFSPKLYPSGWRGGSVARISTYKVVGTIGTGIGVYGMGVSLYDTVQGNVSYVGGGANFLFATIATFGGMKGAFIAASYEAGKVWGPSTW